MCVLQQGERGGNECTVPPYCQPAIPAIPAIPANPYLPTYHTCQPTIPANLSSSQLPTTRPRTYDVRRRRARFNLPSCTSPRPRASDGYEASPVTVTVVSRASRLGSTAFRPGSCVPVDEGARLANGRQLASSGRFWAARLEGQLHRLGVGSGGKRGRVSTLLDGLDAVVG
jgi:hypothetical protein